MKRMLCSLLLGLSVGTASLMSCDCGLLPVCAYRDADIIFLGRVSFTNHDYSAGLNQATLVRFEVEEAFKGIAPDAHQIWVDPGSFTSCYEVYKPGNRYLIFGTLLPAVPQQTAAITIAPWDSSKAKPFPPGFSPSTPPPIYYSPECAGSRNANGTPGFKQDLAMLREYRAGVLLPRVLGHVHMSPYSGWPYLDGPALAGAEITISNAAVKLKTTTDVTGRFSFHDAPPGDYTVQATLAPYRMNPAAEPFYLTGSVNGRLRVPEAGCGYTEIELATTSVLRGIIVDSQGKGVPKIFVRLRIKDGSRRSLGAVTDKQGRFAISGVPDAEVYLSAGIDEDLLSGGTNLNLDMRYRAVYYPGGASATGASALRLGLGETRSLVLRLGSPLEWSRVKVKVVDKDGRPKVGANVNSYGGPPGTGMTRTGARGLGSMPCLGGWEYQLEAAAEYWRSEGKREVVVASRTPFVCGVANNPVVLVLDRIMAGVVAGKAVDSKGALLKYPRVRIYRESETSPRYEGHGDETGRFRIDDVAPGVYTIIIAVEDLGEKTLSGVGVSAGQITDLGAMVWI
jgi:hypothetical protein